MVTCRSQGMRMLRVNTVPTGIHIPFYLTLRKHAYSNILKILPPNNKKFQIKNLIFLYFCSKHGLWYSLESPRRGGSNEYPQSMFLSRNKRNNVYPCKPQFYYIKVGFKGVKFNYAFVICDIINDFYVSAFKLRRSVKSYSETVSYFWHILTKYQTQTVNV